MKDRVKIRGVENWSEMKVPQVSAVLSSDSTYAVIWSGNQLRVIDSQHGSILKVHCTFKVTFTQYWIQFAVVKEHSVFIVSDDGREQVFEEVGVCSAYSKKFVHYEKVTCFEITKERNPMTAVLGTESGFILELVDMELMRSIDLGVSSSISSMIYSAKHDLLVAGLVSSQVVIFTKFSTNSDGFLTKDSATGPVSAVQFIDTSHSSLAIFREAPASLSCLKLPKDLTAQSPTETSRQELADPSSGLLQ